jgi:KDO2-lipid IV(A) lauroyltransferase
MNTSLLHPKHWPSWLAIALLRLLCFLPLTWLLAFGTIIGRVLYHLLKRRRHITEVNIDLCFPELSETDKNLLCQKVIISSVHGMLETAYSWWASDAELLARADYEGLELIAQAQKEGRGILLIGSHFTTLDLAGRILRLKIDVDSSYQKQNNAVFDHCILQFRLKRFTNMVEKTEMRRLIKLIKSGRVMWYASDQDFGRKHSVFAPFFGHQAATINTISGILKLTKAKPLYFSHYRIGQGKHTRYLMRITDPFGENLGSDDVQNATLLNQVIEEAIRFSPEQYMWVHRRFKTRPNPNDAKFYDIAKQKT